MAAPSLDQCVLSPDERCSDAWSAEVWRVIATPGGLLHLEFGEAPSFRRITMERETAQHIATLILDVLGRSEHLSKLDS